jgi:hypothetical protein
MNYFKTLAARESWRRAMKQACLLVAVAVLAGGLSGCTPDFQKNTADVILKIVSIEGEDGTPVFSDVCSGSGGTCSTTNDNASLTLQLLSKNPNLVNPGPFNNVQITHYKVEYLRSDGRNIEGEDVPFFISGNLTATVTTLGPVEISINVVRHQAKEEAPLRNLNEFGGADIITTSARITLFGTTTNGKVVSAVGFLEIVFGDFADAAPATP